MVQGGGGWDALSRSLFHIPYVRSSLSAQSSSSLPVPSTPVFFLWPGSLATKCHLDRQSGALGAWDGGGGDWPEEALLAQVDLEA